MPSQRVLVISDDLDQAPAAVRLRQKGGHGGHNGLRSIIQHLGGSHDFPRIKIGAADMCSIAARHAAAMRQACSNSCSCCMLAFVAQALRTVSAHHALGMWFEAGLQSLYDACCTPAMRVSWCHNCRHLHHNSLLSCCKRHCFPGCACSLCLPNSSVP